MWAYSDNDVIVEFEGESYTLLSKDQKYESEEARKWCLKYWNWHRKSFGTETTEKEVRDKFRFRCFQCQQPVSTVIIPKSDLDHNGNPISFKRTPHFKCSANNCYGSGTDGRATEEYNVITDKSVLPVTELRFPPEEDESKGASTPSVKASKNQGVQKKNRHERKTSTSIAPLCEQFYTYFLNNELTKKFVSVPFISQEAELSYSYLFVNMDTHENSNKRRTGIFYGSPRYWLTCLDAYLILLQSSPDKTPLFIKTKKCESALHAIQGASRGKLLFVLGDISIQKEYSLVDSNSSFWCHALRLPANDNNFRINQLEEKTIALNSENKNVERVIRDLIDKLTKPDVPIDTTTDDSTLNVENSTERQSSNSARLKTVKKSSEQKEPNVRPSKLTVKKPKRSWRNVVDKIKRWFSF